MQEPYFDPFFSPTQSKCFYSCVEGRRVQVRRERNVMEATARRVLSGTYRDRDENMSKLPNQELYGTKVQETSHTQAQHDECFRPRTGQYCRYFCMAWWIQWRSSNIS